MGLVITKKETDFLEEWKDIKGYENIYQVSNRGKIRSMDRKIITVTGKIKNLKGKIIKPHFDKDGYLQISVHKNNKQKHGKVHRLVAEAFIKNPYKKEQVNHIDGNKQNNNVMNLEWCTDKENKEHAKLKGLYNNKGFNNYNSKLTFKQVNRIREEYKEGRFTMKEIAIKYNVSPQHICDIINYKSRKFY